jgi:hypothetical protein
MQVKVLPEPVCPYAIMQQLYPSRAALARRDQPVIHLKPTPLIRPMFIQTVLLALATYLTYGAQSRKTESWSASGPYTRSNSNRFGPSCEAAAASNGLSTQDRQHLEPIHEGMHAQICRARYLAGQWSGVL